MFLQKLKTVLFGIFLYSLTYTVATIIAVSTVIQIILFSFFKRTAQSVSPKRRELPPECLNDPVYGEHCYIQIKNIKLHYVENGDKTKPLLLFLHGFPEFWYSWRHQIKYFSKHYWTVAVDLRGYGDSEKPTGVSQYKIKYLIKDIQNLINALGREKCILVSHDWGAIIGWFFLFKYPEMVEKYVMINMHPSFATTFQISQLIKSWYIFLFQLPWFPEIYLRLNDLAIFDKIFKRMSQDDIDSYKFTYGKAGSFTFPVNYYRANIFKLIFSKKPKDISLPKGMLIYTENDRLVHVENFKNAEKSIENLELSFIKSGTHFLHQRKSEDVNKIIAKFLNISISEETVTEESLY